MSSKPILVVDDDPEIRETLRLTLEMALADRPAPVVTARDGREALGVLAVVSPCVVLLDLMMPVMSGAELLSIMRSDGRWRDVPVVIVSAWRREAAAVEGAQAFLGKPIDVNQLLEVTEKYCS